MHAKPSFPYFQGIHLNKEKIKNLNMMLQSTTATTTTVIQAWNQLLMLDIIGVIHHLSDLGHIVPAARP